MALRKRLIAIAGITVITGGVLCAGKMGLQISEKKTPDETVEEVSLSNQKETINLWYTDSQLTDYLSSVAVSFNDENENYRVVPTLQSGNEFIENINQASLTGEEIPDLYIVGNDTLEKATLAGLTSSIEENTWTDEDSKDTDFHMEEIFPESALHAATYENKLVGYPFYYVSSAMLYNKTYLDNWCLAKMEEENDLVEGEAVSDTSGKDEEVAKDNLLTEEQVQAALDDLEKAAEEQNETDGAEEGETPSLSEDQLEAVEKLELSILPTSIEEMLTFADEYDAPENVEGILKWDVTDIFYNYFVVGDAIDVGGINGDQVNQIDLYNEPAIRGLKVYQELNQFFSIDTEEISYDGVLQDFKDGKMVFTIVTPDAVATMEQAIADGEFPYEYGICSLPDISEDIQAKSLSVTNVLVVNGYSEKKQAANEFAQFLIRQDTENFYNRTGKLASIKDANYGNEKLQAFASEYERSIPIAKMIETNNYWLKLEIAFAKIWQGKDAEQTLRNLSEEIMTQVTGEVYTEEPIIIEEEVEEEYDEIIEEDEDNGSDDAGSETSEVSE